MFTFLFSAATHLSNLLEVRKRVLSHREWRTNSTRRFGRTILSTGRRQSSSCSHLYLILVSGHFHFTSRSIHRLTSGLRVLKTVKIGRPVTRVTESPESPESPGVTKSTNERSRRSGGHEKKTAENDENKPKLLPKLAGKFKSIQMRKKTCRHILSVDPGFKPWI